MSDAIQPGSSLDEVQQFCQATGLDAALERFAFENYIHRGLGDAGFDGVTIRRIPEHSLTIAAGTCPLQDEAQQEASTASRILGCLRAEGLNPDADLVSVEVVGRVVTVKVGILEPTEPQSATD
jgi:hypothetical protein